MLPKILKNIFKKKPKKKKMNLPKEKGTRRKSVYDKYLLEKLEEEGFQPSKEYLEGKKKNREEIKKEEASAGIGILYDKKEKPI